MSASNCEKHVRLNIYPVFFIDLHIPFVYSQ